MNKKQTHKEWRNELTIYKIAFWITISCFIIFIGIVLFSSTIEQNNCNPCDYLVSTPSWLVNNKIAGVGYLPNITTEIMIENNITFIYSDSCGVCFEQKKILDMELLELKGLVIKC